MSLQLDTSIKSTGVKFKIFPQPRFLNSLWQPEEVTLSVNRNEILPGPADHRMFVADALSKSRYGDSLKPQYQGRCNEPVKAGDDGNFLHLDINSREFSCASMYAGVRRVLDIWEDYFQHPIPWHFETDFERLELIPLIDWDNAHSGYGFMEFGFVKKGNGFDIERPYCQNFDVLAHEVGHSIIYSQVGVPSSSNFPNYDYMAMHESAGDLVAIISSLHFNSVVEHLLKNTKGNLFTINELDRIGELSDSDQFRIAFNSYRMSTIPTMFESHSRSLPLTGGIFDIMVEVFQKKLVDRNLIDEALAKISTQGLVPVADQDLKAIQSAFELAYNGNEEAFKLALLEARDYLGKLLALTWKKLNPNGLTFHDIVRELMRSDYEIEDSQGAHQQTIRECFAWREIKLTPDSLLMQAHTVIDDDIKVNINNIFIEKTVNDLVRIFKHSNNSARQQIIKKLANGFERKMRPAKKRM